MKICIYSITMCRARFVYIHVHFLVNSVNVAIKYHDYVHATKVLSVTTLKRGRRKAVTVKITSWGFVAFLNF